MNNQTEESDLNYDYIGRMLRYDCGNTGAIYIKIGENLTNYKLIPLEMKLIISLSNNDLELGKEMSVYTTLELIKNGELRTKDVSQFISNMDGLIISDLLLSKGNKIITKYEINVKPNKNQIFYKNDMIYLKLIYTPGVSLILESLLFKFKFLYSNTSNITTNTPPLVGGVRG